MSKKTMIAKKILVIVIAIAGAVLFGTEAYAQTTEGGNGGGANGCSK